MDNAPSTTDKILFIISTPLHAYVAAEIAFEFERMSYSCFLLMSEGASMCRPLLEAAGELCKGYFIVDEGSVTSAEGAGIPATFTKELFKARFLPKLDNKLQELSPVDFDRVYFFSPNALTAYIRYKHPEANFILCEDGVGTYSGKIASRVFSFDIRMIDNSHCISRRIAGFGNKFLFGEKLNYKINDLFVHCPEMLQYHFHGNVHKIDPGNKFREILREYCSYGDSTLNYSHFDFIFLGQPIAALCSMDAVYSLLNLIDSSGAKWTYRPHPRETELPSSIPIEENPGSWELRSMSEISDSSCLISVCSSAMGIPKMLFGKEPTLIFLHRLIPSKAPEGWSSTDRFAEALASSYRAAGRVHIPNSIVELEELISHQIEFRDCLQGMNIDRK